jgi:hypothetical protein
MTQALWPQCQSCFSVQGAAVKENRHELIYNWRLRPYHASLLLALAVTDLPFSRHFTLPLIEATLDVHSFFQENLSDILKKIKGD